jgi:hypothetical protein
MEHMDLQETDSRPRGAYTTAELAANLLPMFPALWKKQRLEVFLERLGQRQQQHSLTELESDQWVQILLLPLLDHLWPCPPTFLQFRPLINHSSIHPAVKFTPQLQGSRDTAIICVMKPQLDSREQLQERWQATQCVDGRATRTRTLSSHRQ